MGLFGLPINNNNNKNNNKNERFHNDSMSFDGHKDENPYKINDTHNDKEENSNNNNNNNIIPPLTLNEIEFKLNEINNYLRNQYYYCLWCGIKYDNQKLFNTQCPGFDLSLHDTLD